MLVKFKPWNPFQVTFNHKLLAYTQKPWQEILWSVLFRRSKGIITMFLFSHCTYKPWHISHPGKPFSDNCFKLDSWAILELYFRRKQHCEDNGFTASSPPSKNSACFVYLALFHTLSRHPLSNPYHSLQAITQTRQSWRSSLSYNLKLQISKIIFLKKNKPKQKKTNQLWCNWDNLDGVGIPQPWRHFPQQDSLG